MRRLLVVCLLALPGLSAPQDLGHPISMWQIEGNSNRIYLLGSVHLLREQDHPIPTAINDAYEDAEILIMELDMDDIDPIEMAGLVNELGMIADGGSLQEIMGPALYGEAVDYASQLEIPIEMLGETEPWLAAITVEQMIMLRIGFNPKYGIEFHLTAMAGRDEKEILGFETAREQLEFLDGLSMSAQRSLLMQTLRESLSIIICSTVMAGLVNELGMIADGGSLQEIMGPALYGEAVDYASQLEIPIEMLGETEPWLAAITVEQMIMLRIGFNPKYGIEFHLTAMAGRDEKEILGFETAREQLEFLDGLSMSAQRSLLMQTLQESLSIEEDINLLINAWRYGDIDYFEETLLAEMRKFPELYKTLVVDRNRAWVEKIKKLTTEKDDYLVVVGALHLVGEDGVPALLSKQGISADQLNEPGI